MILKSFRSQYPVLIEGEGAQATYSFVVGLNGIVSIDATPMGIEVRRQDSLVDLLLTPGGIGVLEKRSAQPAGLKKK